MDYSKMNRDELITICKEKGIKGYSGKKKENIVGLLNTEESEQPVVKNTSPLRYPGGKTRAISIIEKYVNTHYPGRKTLLSPFFGGGSFELYMKTKGYLVKGNDLFVPLYTFWSILQTKCDELIDKIKNKMPVTKETFHTMRSSINTTKDDGDKASSYFVINRTSFSGATLCGGFSKQAAEGRLTTSSLERLKKCDLAGIDFTNTDCNAFLNGYPETTDTIVYADPPYYIETYIYGKDGDMHENFNHEAFANTITKRSDWIISYNDCEYIRTLYKDCRIFKESWAYGMNATKKSSEIIILPPLIS